MKLGLFKTQVALQYYAGTIRVTENKRGTKRKYKVLIPSKFIKGKYKPIGETSERIFRALLNTEWIYQSSEVKTKSNGDKYWYYDMTI